MGPTRTGKTEWARSLGPHMYFNNMFNIDLWDPQAEYAVFDDIDWKYFPAKKSFLGAQKQFCLADKYRKKRLLKWGKPCIILCNPEDAPTEWAITWYRENCIQEQIYNKLY